MKVKIGNAIHDSENEPIALIFEDDREKEVITGHLINMSPRENAIRVYVQYPKEMNIFARKNFINAIPDTKEKLSWLIVNKK